MKRGLAGRIYSTMKKILLATLAGIVSLLIFLAPVALAPVAAQSGEGTVTPTPTGEDQGEPLLPPVHLVQPGETLTSIAAVYSTTVELLQQLNDIGDPSLLQVGQELIVPGSNGMVVMAVHTVQLGDTLRGLAASHDTTVEAIAAGNRLVNPYYLAAGRSLTVLGTPGSDVPQPLSGAAHFVQAGDTLLTVAVMHNVSPAVVAQANGLHYPTYLYPGQRLRIPGEEPYQFLPGPWKRVAVRPLPLVQGESAAIYVESLWPGRPYGEFAGQSLHFAPDGDGYVAFAGVDAFTPAGRYTLEIGGGEGQPWQPFSQDIDIVSGEYGIQQVTVGEELSPLLDPQVRAEEDAFLATVYDHFQDVPVWEAPFQEPVTNTVVTARYGDGRSYNGGPVEIFHTGIDYAGAVGSPIYAPAAGTIVFSDTLQLRGNTLIIDHGLGVMTGFYHLSEVLVGVGETVEAGQIVARAGSTGLSSGPHLHWDLRVSNVPINALQWTRPDFIGETFP
jgi:murein DD-endopeptidase MepM/ murein hydrolase activator NlpD